MTISAGQVRTLGNLPEAVKDATIAPHLSRAVRDVEDRSGIAAGAWGSHARAADLIEAAGCLALGYLAPVLNTMYLADATRMPGRIGARAGIRKHRRPRRSRRGGHLMFSQEMLTFLGQYGIAGLMVIVVFMFAMMQRASAK